MEIALIAFALFCSLLGAMLADRLHREPAFWFIPCAMFGPLAMLVLLVWGDGRGTRPCPACGDEALQNKPRCRHCGALVAEHQAN